MDNLKIKSIGDEYCSKCKAWCCYNELVYAGEQELHQLGVKNISQEENGACQFLKDDLCSVYNYRPFECHIFPFEVKRLNNKLTWIIWKICPAYEYLEVEKSLQKFEQKLLPKLNIDYLEAYLTHSLKFEKIKYSNFKYQKLRAVNISMLAKQ